MATMRTRLFRTVLACMLLACVVVAVWGHHPAERATLLTQSQLQAILGGDTGTGSCQVPDVKPCGLNPQVGTVCPNITVGVCQKGKLPGISGDFCILLNTAVNGVCKDDNTSSRQCTFSYPGGQCGTYGAAVFGPDGCGVPNACPSPSTPCGDAKSSATQGGDC